MRQMRRNERDLDVRGRKRFVPITYGAGDIASLDRQQFLSTSADILSFHTYHGTYLGLVGNRETFLVHLSQERCLSILCDFAFCQKGKYLK